MLGLLVLLMGHTIMLATLSEWNLNMNVNALGVLYCYRSAARQMIKQGRGGRLIGASTVCALKGMLTPIVLRSNGIR
jgi:NAD(P)-dependent dehydrogenase (short-subunit alcohol dehydrogenase family)